MREDEGPLVEVEHVELDQVDARVDRGAESAQGVLRRERRGAAVPDTKNPALVPAQVDHAGASVERTDRRRSRRSHHQDASATTTAWATAIPAASFAVSCQNTSG